ncbi:hypothetical protein OAU50_07130 [Planctomycetota bacterium]|nr:hypothetical protein [Planctomycetota bacterium]
MMKKLEAAFDGDDKVSFLYIQTVFEGAKSNTFENGKADIKKFGLKGPFGQDDTRKTMRQFKTRGTPWVAIIGPDGELKFNDFNYPGDDVDSRAKGAKKFINELNGVENTPDTEDKPKENEKKPEPEAEDAEEDEFSVQG